MVLLEVYTHPLKTYLNNVQVPAVWSELVIAEAPAGFDNSQALSLSLFLSQESKYEINVRWNLCVCDYYIDLLRNSF